MTALAKSASLALLTLAACTGPTQHSTPPMALAEFVKADGGSAGTAEIRVVGTGVRLHVGVTGQAPGVHGAHIHTTGRCVPPDFASAGGHLNPAGHAHGTDNPAGSHMGDLPNLTVATDGSGSLDIALPGTPAEWNANLFDADGSAIVIHAAQDDYRTDPSGNSGARLACGVFRHPD